jgi:ribonuclease BN (tRNA processing enzyme)
MAEKILIHFLGTNGWFDSKTGNTICVLIETPNEYILLDAGNGLAKADQFITKPKPVYLFLSHFHTDHIEGLHVLAKFRFEKGLKIYGPKGTKKILDLVVNVPFTVPIKDLATKTEVYEIDDGSPLGLNVKFAPMRHSTICYGYRFDFSGKTIAYCTDTGVCPGMYELGKNADLLITECAYKPGPENKEWPHLNPQTASLVAKESGAKQLALVHFDAGEYLSMGERAEAQKIARKTFKNTVATKDGLTIKI